MSEESFLEQQQKLIGLCSDADKLAFALKQYLGVTFFRYVKSYPTNEKYIICNNEGWLKAYFAEKFYNNELADYRKHPIGSKGVHIHHPCTRDHPACNFWRANSEIGDYTCFIYFFVKYKDYFESYNFGLKGDAHQTNDYFFNNQHLYKHFFLYFKSRGKDLLQQAEEAKFKVDDTGEYNLQDNWLLGINESMTKIVMQEMPLLEVYLDDEFVNVPLSLKEARSLKYFLEGYSMQESAEKLDISDSVHIETLTSVMEKLRVKSYNDLRSLCYQKDIALKLSFLNKDIR